MQIRIVIVTFVAVACFTLFTDTIQAQGNSLNNNLFAQYYTQGAASQVTASMYPSPHWVPKQVGHTYNTYQPLSPHEMMYTHSRNYYNYYGDSSRFYAKKYGRHSGGAALNKTTVVWQSGCSHMGPLPGNMQHIAGLRYKLASHKYGLNNRVRHGKRHGGCHRRGCRGGCETGACDSGCSGESYGDGFYSAPTGGCANGSCALKLTDETIDR